MFRKIVFSYISGGVDAELYRNRKGYFSLNVQVISDANLRINDVVARWPGSTHDSTIFSNSSICARFETGEIKDGYILGDGGYPCKRYLLTPLGTTTTAAERRYNYSQIRTRNPVERTFGVLKRRFPCLKLGLRIQVKNSLSIIVACIVLHNIALRHGETEPQDDVTIVNGSRIFEEVPEVVLNVPRGRGAGTTATRAALINDYFSK